VQTYTYPLFFEKHACTEPASWVTTKPLERQKHLTIQQAIGPMLIKHADWVGYTQLFINNRINRNYNCMNSQRHVR